jgi:site-specific recombinase XerD
MLPSQQVLEQIARKVKKVPNRRKESKRRIHFGLFLLSYKSGLRVNEAIGFDLSSKTEQGLYRIKKTKGKKERFVYVSKEVISELKKQN